MSVNEHELRFVEVAAASLAGPATAMACASISGRVVAGDDRGEVGLWDPSGERLLGFRTCAAVCDADISPAGDRIAVRGADGELTVADARGRQVFTLALGGPGLVRLDPSGDSLYCIDPVAGRVDTFNAWGKRIAGFEVPSPVGSCVIHPRDKGLIVSTSRGIVARFTAWGEQVWAVDLAQYTGPLAIDSRGTLLLVASFSRGADGILPDKGAPFGAFDVGKSVESAAVSRNHVLAGTSDGQLFLLDRAAKIVGVARTGGTKAIALGIRDDSRHAAVRLDDGTVRFWHVSPYADKDPEPSRMIGGAPEGHFPPKQAFRRKLFAPGALMRPSLVSVSACGRYLSVTGEGRRVFLLLRDGALVQDLRHEGSALGLEAAEDGSSLLVTSREIRWVSTQGTRVVRSFGLDAFKAVLATDAKHVAIIDELGVLRLVDAVTGADLFSLQQPATDPPRTVAVAAGHLAWQRRGGEIFVADGGEARLVAAHHVGGEVPRLAAAGTDGPFIAAGPTITAHAWDGTERWRQRVGGLVQTVVATAGGGVVCVTAGESRRMSRDGAVLARFPTPPGRLGCLCAADDGSLVFAFFDGRRIAVVDGHGRPSWHTTLREEVTGSSIAREGRSLAVLAGDGVLLLETVPPRRPEPTDVVINTPGMASQAP